MEVCGNILTENNYSDFYLKCIYCSHQTKAQEWEEFFAHVRDHSSPSPIDCITEEEFPPESIEGGSDVDVDDEEFLDNDKETVDHKSDISFEYLEEYEDIGSSEEQCGAYMEVTEIEPMDNDIAAEDVKEEQISNDVEPKYQLEINFKQHDVNAFYFIEIYKNHPCLWNPSDPNHLNAEARDQALKSLLFDIEINSSIYLTEAELKKTIQQLHSQFASATKLAASQKNRNGMISRYLARCEFLVDNCKQPNNPPEERVEFEEELKLNFSVKNDVTTSFVEICAVYPELYDADLEEFASIDARAQAYRQMGENLSQSANIQVNETDIYMGVKNLRKWYYSALKRSKSKLPHGCTETELLYLDMCKFLPNTLDTIIFNCDNCPRSFQGEYNLRVHMFKAHKVGELPFLCSKCPRRFDKMCDMVKHRQRAHLKKMLKCTYCDSTFAVRTDLHVHIRTHTGEKPYICEICGRTFRLKLMLTNHISGRHLNLRPFKCDMCPKDFRKKAELKEHIKSHLDIRDRKCESCDKAYKSYSALSRHRKQHLKEQMLLEN